MSGSASSQVNERWLGGAAPIVEPLSPCQEDTGGYPLPILCSFVGQPPPPLRPLRLSPVAITYIVMSLRPTAGQFSCVFVPVEFVHRARSSSRVRQGNGAPQLPRLPKQHLLSCRTVSSFALCL